MSLDSLTDDERASFMLGQALRRAMLGGDKDRAAATLSAKAWAVYSALCDDVLTVHEAVEMRRTTGLIDMSEQWAEYVQERNGRV
jgi:hypothetical protein